MNNEEVRASACALDGDPSEALLATLATLPGVVAQPLFVRLS